ncbi:MAG: PEP-CTERM sorting domain-containing protein [Isosphaeraceae bacterium]|nr:PEP-CTERM sorting domain-containing protein [Isosphaeraceae bacterium]
MTFPLGRFWAGLVIVFAVASQARAGFVVNDLGVLPNGLSSFGMGINRSGVIAGTMNLDFFTNRAFLSGGSPIDLGTLDGGRFSAGYGINDGGLVTGDADTKINGVFRNRAFRSQGAGALLDMGVLPGDLESFGRAINASGHVAGWSAAGDGSTRAMVAFAPDVIVPLAGPGSKAFAINDSGTVAGEYTTVGGALSAFRVGVGGAITDLGRLPGSSGSSARGINAAGDVVGFTTGAVSRAFLAPASGGSMIDLGILPQGRASLAADVNEAMEVVGHVDYGFGATTAFLWLPSTRRMIDLNTLISPTSGWHLLAATAINGESQITGYGLIGGNIHAFRLDPILGEPLDSAPGTAVPEPSTLVLTAAGALVLAAFAAARRRRLGA